jgi:hypothetical protein
MHQLLPLFKIGAFGFAHAPCQLLQELWRDSLSIIYAAWSCLITAGDSLIIGCNVNSYLMS